MIDQLMIAFQKVNDGFSTDRVLADPELNTRFISACREQGLVASAEELNRNLINLRKSGKLGKQKSKQTRFDDDDEYRFAAEIAVRHIERRDQITLDDILVNPKLATEFDAICEDLAPGHLPLQYRWAALKLRKSRGLSPETISHAIPAETVLMFSVGSINIDNIPNLSGIYCFISERETLYVGEASSLQVRLKKHLKHSDNQFLARWIWKNGIKKLSVEIHVYPEINTKTRKALEIELIRSRKPLFNVLGKLK